MPCPLKLIVKLIVGIVGIVGIVDEPPKIKGLVDSATSGRGGSRSRHPTVMSASGQAELPATCRGRVFARRGFDSHGLERLSLSTIVFDQYFLLPRTSLFAGAVGWR
ncbi:hypothetical protein BU24DRAFT_409701 [Aaosphaeria arxii CBS 175.79]|uniref:Uncharacterized protein n=1 Tax=Aaosphaeria arxii CBS 175.79 TaxID=1450172 RepID=A0A6A5XTT9_9PLEO|nr:uncharacterized protein BU24DRAFT_409701 [Aaosphaeria arxii CBS 175.79]KAF2016612.1 hypothetical protein BU24DRAFT_409701 [Aaosphaeria arxii CBS 175.79]